MIAFLIMFIVDFKFVIYQTTFSKHIRSAAFIGLGKKKKKSLVYSEFTVWTIGSLITVLSI